MRKDHQLCPNQVLCVCVCLWGWTPTIATVSGRESCAGAPGATRGNPRRAATTSIVADPLDSFEIRASSKSSRSKCRARPISAMPSLIETKFAGQTPRKLVACLGLFVATCSLIGLASAASHHQQVVTRTWQVQDDKQLASLASLARLKRRTAAASKTSSNQSPPEFSAPIGNITAVVGRDVRLVCTVENLGPHQVSFEAVDSSQQSEPFECFKVAARRRRVAAREAPQATRRSSSSLLLVRNLKQRPALGPPGSLGTPGAGGAHLAPFATRRD